jgi:hypothetical protein
MCEHEPILSPLPAARLAGASSDVPPSMDAARALDSDRARAVEARAREAEDLLSALLLDTASIKAYVAHCRRPDLNQPAAPGTILGCLEHARELTSRLAGPIAALGELTR